MLASTHSCASSILMPESLRSASLSMISPYPEEAPRESTIYIFLSGYLSCAISAALFAELYVPDIPEDRVT